MPPPAAITSAAPSRRRWKRENGSYATVSLISTRVYQGALGQVDQRIIKALERVSIGDLLPDLTLILDLPVPAGLARLALRRGGGEPDRFEAENIEFHEKLRQAYLALAAAELERCVVIDASGETDEVAKKVWTAVSSRLDPAALTAGSEHMVA